jgi:hypothetical protein
MSNVTTLTPKKEEKLSVEVHYSDGTVDGPYICNEYGSLVDVENMLLLGGIDGIIGNSILINATKMNKMITKVVQV